MGKVSKIFLKMCKDIKFERKFLLTFIEIKWSEKVTVTTFPCIMPKYKQNPPTVTWRVALKLWLQPQRTFFSIESYWKRFFKELHCIYIWHLAVRITQALCLFAFYISVSCYRLIHVFWNRGRSLSEDTFFFEISAAATQKKKAYIWELCGAHVTIWKGGRL